jgi:hypothetical protein
LHKKEATRFAQDATLLFSLFLLTSFEILCIGGTHTLFVFCAILCLKAYFLSMYVTQWLFPLLCIFLIELASELCSTYTQTRKPSHGRDTCAMLGNTQKATLNRIGTQRKKRGYKGGASYTYAKVRWCQNTRLAVMSMEVKSKDLSEFWCADVIVAMMM